MAWFETWFKNDLAKPINVVQLQGVMFNLDNLANKIGVELEYNGQPAALEGTIAGYVIRNDGTTLNLTTNTGKDGNKAWVILPQEAYTVEGPISIVIKLVYNSAETTIGACAGYVTRSRTSSEIAPTGTVIPSLASLEAAIAAANAAAANAADATDYIAPTEEESTASAAHAVGSYFIYDGKLMKATSAIAQGETIVPYASGVTSYNCAEVANGLSGDVYNVTNTANAAANNAADAQQLVAPVESMAGMPTGAATMAHATGSYFVYGGALCEATSDIAIGDTITTTGTGANAAQVPGGAMGEVADLKSALTQTRDELDDLREEGVTLYNTGMKLFHCPNGTTFTVETLDGTAFTGGKLFGYSSEKTQLFGKTLATVYGSSYQFTNNSGNVEFIASEEAYSNGLRVYIPDATKVIPRLDTLDDKTNKIKSKQDFILNFPFITGLYILPNGNVVESNDYEITDYIPYFGGNIFIDVETVSPCGISYYSNKNQSAFISGTNNVNGATTVLASDVPTGTKYIRVGNKKTYANPSVIVDQYNFTLNLIQQNTEDIKAPSDFVHISFKNGIWINPTNGVETSGDSSRYSATGFIPYFGGSITVDVGVATPAGIAYFKEDKTFISAVNNFIEKKTVAEADIPAGTRYIRCSNDYTKQINPSVTIFDAERLATFAASNVSGEIAGKQILIFGDSITTTCDITFDANDCTTSYNWRNPSNHYVNEQGVTVNYSMWAKIIKENYSPLEIRNYAMSGAHYKTTSVSAGNELQNLTKQMTLALNDLTNPNDVFSVDDFTPDIIIFALGTNDGATATDTYESAMSKSYNELDTSKFSEAVRYALQTFRERFPSALIFVELPIQRADVDVLTWDTRSILQKMASRFSCILIDGATESGIIKDNNVWNNLGATLKDGLHPNEIGQELLTRMFVSAIKRYSL